MGRVVCDVAVHAHTSWYKLALKLPGLYGSAFMYMDF